MAEVALAHFNKDQVEAAYQRDDLFEKHPSADGGLGGVLWPARHTGGGGRTETGVTGSIQMILQTRIRPSRKRSRAPNLRGKRREHARQRIKAGSCLTLEERQRLLEMLARLGRNDPDTQVDLDAIEYAIAHYWHLMAALIDDDACPLESIERLAAELGQQLAELPPHYLAEFSESDPEWGLLALDPQVLTALEEQDVLVWPETYQLPLRRQRRGRFPHQAGSRLETAQYVVERVETWVGQARNRRTKRPRGRQFEYELRWLLAALKRIWVERLGRPLQPQAWKRGSLSEFVSAIVAVADPHLPPATAPSVLRGMTAKRTPRPGHRRSIK